MTIQSSRTDELTGDRRAPASPASRSPRTATSGAQTPPAAAALAVHPLPRDTWYGIDHDPSPSVPTPCHQHTARRLDDLASDTEMRMAVLPPHPRAQFARCSGDGSPLPGPGWTGARQSPREHRVYSLETEATFSYCAQDSTSSPFLHPEPRACSSTGSCSSAARSMSCAIVVHTS